MLSWLRSLFGAKPDVRPPVDDHTGVYRFDGGSSAKTRKTAPTKGATLFPTPQDLPPVASVPAVVPTDESDHYKWIDYGKLLGEPATPVTAFEAAKIEPPVPDAPIKETLDEEEPIWTRGVTGAIPVQYRVSGSLPMCVTGLMYHPASAMVAMSGFYVQQVPPGRRQHCGTGRFANCSWYS